MTIGDRIKKKRADLDMTLEDVAKEMNLSRQTLSRYETGIISSIPSDRIEQLANILRTTPSYLMGWEDSVETITEDELKNSKPSTNSEGFKNIDDNLIKLLTSLDPDEIVLARSILKSIIDARKK